jgi:hypothetical protein
MQFDKKINRLLAEWVSVINALVAVGIPSVTALLTAGFASSGPFTSDFSFLGFLGGLVFGGAAGMLMAGALCGVLATLIDIRNSLARKAES